jgi:sugar transferase (PEP-CTERM/EpsH1 system associated)
MPRPIKILHVVHSLEVGGLENGLINLVNRLDPDRFWHTICCLKRAGRLAQRIERKGIEVLELGLAGNGFHFPVLTLRRHFRRLAPDIVHTRGWGTVDAVFAAKLAGVPRIIHGEHGRDLDDAQGKKWKRNKVRRVVGYMVDRYVVVCEFFRDWLRKECRIPERKIAHIPNGVDTSKFSPANGALCGKRAGQSASRNALRQQLGLPPDAILVGSVGRLDAVKDLRTLLSGFARIKGRFPSARLVMVGDGPLRQELFDFACELNLTHDVQWLGQRDDVPLLYRCFDLFVQTSVFEGMSNTVLEAMASGLPVIVTRTGGNEELVTTGENGVVIEVGAVEALAEAMANYLQDGSLRGTHGAGGRQRARERFDLSLMARRYAALYEGQNDGRP